MEYQFLAAIWFGSIEDQEPSYESGMITKYGFSEAVALNSKPHANVVFHRNEKHFGNTIQVNATGDTLTIIANII